MTADTPPAPEASPAAADDPSPGAAQSGSQEEELAKHLRFGLLIQVPEMWRSETSAILAKLTHRELKIVAALFADTFERGQRAGGAAKKSVVAQSGQRVADVLRARRERG